jgi:hypothetical protein
LISRSISARLSVAAAGCAGTLSVELSAFEVVVDVICAKSEAEESTTTAAFKRTRKAKNLQRLYPISLLKMFTQDSGNAEQTLQSKSWVIREA